MCAEYKYTMKNGKMIKLILDLIRQIEMELTISINVNTLNTHLGILLQVRTAPSFSK